MLHLIFGISVGVLGIGWVYRELVWRARADMQHRVQKILLSEADGERAVRKDKVLLVTAALDAKKKRQADESRACLELWNSFWIKLFETRGIVFNSEQDRQGDFIWQRAIEAFIDLRRFRGSFTPEQLRAVARLVLAVKAAVRDRERAYQSLSPAGEIEFDNEGGFKVS